MVLKSLPEEILSFILEKYQTIRGVAKGIFEVTPFV
jgi:hypothetical protein